MFQRKLPGVDLSLSAFSFGTASLHHVSAEANRQRLLFKAADGGFTHYDTSPLYGFGVAERSLAPLLAAHPNYTVATKVGLYAPGGSGQSQGEMLARKLVGKVLPVLSRAQVDWSVTRAEKSFNASLKRLGREQVDILFLHEPDRNLIVTQEWLGWFESIRDRYRFVGVSGTADRIAPFLTRGEPLSNVVQVADSLAGSEADVVFEAGRQLQITYGYVSADRQTPAEQTLAGALQRNSTGSILISTRNLNRISQYTRLAA